MRIGFGSDHRGGKIAYAILTGVLFPENGTELKALEKTGAFHLNGKSPSVVGALMVNTRETDVNPSVSSEIVDLLPDLKDSVKGCDETGSLHQVDYPDIAEAVAEKVSSGQADFGVLVCATGIGMCIVANKFKGIRAATCSNVQACELSRRHNNANILCVPGEIVGAPVAVAMVKRWLETKYDGGRHQGRLDKIALIEAKTGL
ncbi:MAG: RpiB/LacA/LacB family sugar-phosphate isomerase [Thermoguttaceae bacterium]